MSYFSHSQIWALHKDGRLYVGGKTNRAQVAFEREMLEILDKLSLAPQGEEKAIAVESRSA